MPPNKTKSASGMGNIRKTTRTIKGKTYTYYEARYTEGFDPSTGKQIQRSITGKTQKEVAQKLKKVLASIDAGSYCAPQKMTVGEWLDIWSSQYLGNVKDSTVAAYKATIRTHLKPGLGAARLDMLDTAMIQRFYNKLSVETKDKKAISPKTIKNIHGVLHKALQQSLLNGYIKANPTNACVLPRVEKRSDTSLDEDHIAAFLKAIQGHQFEYLYIVTLFTGMREAEALGLLWNCVDFENQSITVNKQLQLVRGGGGQYKLVQTKNSKSRTFAVAPFVMDILRKTKDAQDENQRMLGESWSNSEGYVFTNPLGDHLRANTVYKNFKKIVRELGIEKSRFHDLRHSFAVMSIKSGDQVKNVQTNLGHATASFTLDVYAHVTKQMQRESAEKMQSFIQSIRP